MSLKGLHSLPFSAFLGMQTLLRSSIASVRRLLISPLLFTAAFLLHAGCQFPVRYRLEAKSPSRLNIIVLMIVILATDIAQTLVGT